MAEHPTGMVYIFNENTTVFVFENNMFENHLKGGKSQIEILENLYFTLHYWRGGGKSRI